MINLILILVLLIFIYLNVKLTNNEKFDTYSVDVIDTITKQECYMIVETILEYLNKKYNKNLVAGNIDRAEKTYGENRLDYKINIFIYNPQRYTNKKINFNVTLEDNKLIINSIRNGISREILEEERGGVDSRGSVIYKPRINMDSVKPVDKQKNNFVNIQYKELSDKNESINNIKNRTSWILDKDAQEFEDNNTCVFPSKVVANVWDDKGIQLTLNNKCSDSNMGTHHGVHKFRKIPNFHVSNFTLNDDNYHWLFDQAQDSASRPIGVTGARGSS